jgi:glycosyltransferase involved in cell wall biosynthesis
MFDVSETKTESFGVSTKDVSKRLRHIALIGNFPPRRCGIATFTADIFDAVRSANPKLDCDVVAMRDPVVPAIYPDAVTHEINPNEIEDYAHVARQLKDDGVELVCVQHEYGIFGGAAGAHILLLLEQLRCPVVTTLHTVLEFPNDEQRSVLERLIERSSRVVVMSRKGRDILRSTYNAPLKKIAIIPHGAPMHAPGKPEELKARFGLEGREVLLTFGLLSPNKGLEHAIRALPNVVKARPDVMYVILGATHPHLVAREGEGYRESLEKLAAELGVEAHVRFVNEFVDNEKLLAYLGAADIYVTPYLHEAQVTSGTLSYAVGLGKPVISTPYWHAAELLANGVGVLTPFADAQAIEHAMLSLICDPHKRAAIAAKARAKGRETNWARIGELYLQAFEDSFREEERVNRPTPPRDQQRRVPSTMKFEALERMTDDCGIYQHAVFHVPNRNHGYCVDDNARALILTQRVRRQGVRAIDKFAPVYAAFVEHAWNDSAGRFRNFMGYDRRWLEERGSEDSCGRAFWSVAETARLAADDQMRMWANALADRVVPHVTEWRSLRAQAFSVLGLCALIEARAKRGDLMDQIAGIAQSLQGAFNHHAREDWCWFEPVLAYDNARVPEALLRAGTLLRDKTLRDTGMKALNWLTLVQTGGPSRFRPVGTRSFGKAYTMPDAFDQQALEAAATVDACWAAFEASHDPRWAEEAHRAHAWYLGENDLAVVMATEDGGCYDGIGVGGVNRNQGAESILSYMLAACAMQAHAAVSRAC